MALDLNDVVRIVLTWSGPLSSVAQNVWHYQVTSGNGGTPATVLDAIRDQYATAHSDIATHQSDDWAVTDFEMLQWDFTNNQWDSVASQSENLIDGTGTTDTKDHGVAFYIVIETDPKRRSGRHYIPGFELDTTTNGQINAAELAAIALYLADFNDPVTADGVTLTWCTFNTDSASSLFESAALATGNGSVSSIPGYQRRRKPGVGI